MRTDKKILIVPDFMIALKALDSLGTASITKLHLYTGITYSHIFDIKKAIVDKGWVLAIPQGRQTLLTLTDAGCEFVHTIKQLLVEMEVSDEDLKKYRGRGKIKSRKNLPNTVDDISASQGENINNKDDSIYDDSPEHILFGDAESFKKEEIKNDNNNEGI